MFATVIIEQPATNKLAIPRDSVVRINDHFFVYVAAGTRPEGQQIFKRRLIQIPERLGPPQRGGSTARLPVMPPEPEAIAVLAGLAEGEQVLVESARRGPDAATVVLSAEQANGRISSVVVEQQDVPHAITIGGRLTFDDSKVTHVFPPVSGRITRLLAGFGDHVKKGAPLAIILSPDLGSAFSDELKAKADLIAAQHEWKRQREMYAAKASAERDMEAAEDNYGKAKAEYERAKQKTRMLRGGPVDSHSQEFVLRSPIEGDVIARTANPGLEVQGQYSGGGNVVELFTIGKIDRLWLLGDAYEMDLPFLKTGAGLELTVSAYPGRTFRGNVDWISDTLDPVMRTAKVRCVLPNSDGVLRPEMYGVVRIAAPAGRVVAVPREAVLRVGDETVVFVEQEHLADGRVSFRGRRVITGPASGGMVPVLDGLTAGERVATRGSIFLLGT
jgi:cobalt-zinc-cadmium efflux system membrane fusion protein